MPKKFDRWKAFGVLVSLARGSTSMRRLAKDLGMSSATVCRIESGKEPSAENFLRVCEWLTPSRISAAGVIARRTASFLEKFR